MHELKRQLLEKTEDVGLVISRNGLSCEAPYQAYSFNCLSSSCAQFPRCDFGCGSYGLLLT